MTVYIYYPHSMRDAYFGQILWSDRGATYGSAVKPRKHSKLPIDPNIFSSFFKGEVYWIQLTTFEKLFQINYIFLQII